MKFDNDKKSVIEVIFFQKNTRFPFVVNQKSFLKQKRKEHFCTQSSESCMPANDFLFPRENISNIKLRKLELRWKIMHLWWHKKNLKLPGLQYSLSLCFVLWKRLVGKLLAYEAIGWFYEAILATFENAIQAIFAGNTRYFLSPFTFQIQLY